MIDFRYHLVSIIAIFLALAVGLVVGATTLPGATETALTKAEHALTKQNAALGTQNAAQRNELNADQAFAQATANRILPGLLAGRKVVLVVPPNTDTAMVSGVTTALEQAGATVTGQVTLQSSFFDFSASTEDSLNGLAKQWESEAGVTLAQNSNSTVSGQQAAATILGPAILTKSPTGVGLPADTSHTILSQFNGYLQVSPTRGSTLAEASLAVVFTPDSSPSSSAQATDMSQALDALATQLHADSLGTVMAGSVSAIPNSAITGMNGSGSVSTVDYADTTTGQIEVAEALAELVQGKAPTSYGVEPGTAPSPAPSPSVSPTPTPTSTPAGKGKTK